METNSIFLCFLIGKKYQYDKLLFFHFLKTCRESLNFFSKLKNYDNLKKKNTVDFAEVTKFCKGTFTSISEFKRFLID